MCPWDRMAVGTDGGAGGLRSPADWRGSRVMARELAMAHDSHMMVTDPAYWMWNPPGTGGYMEDGAGQLSREDLWVMEERIGWHYFQLLQIMRRVGEMLRER
ncbi:hypothetical protein N9L68_08240 [bacterium]|nr:hypothetical protein [bacterium]